MRNAGQSTLPPSQRVRCSVCGLVTAFLVHHTHVQEFRSSRRLVEWDECFACNAKADARAAALKAEIEADRRVKLPPTPQRMHNRERLPFIDQIEVSE